MANYEIALAKMREGVTRDAKAMLRDYLPPEKLAKAAVRVGLAFNASIRAAKDPSVLLDCSPDSYRAAIAQCAIADLYPSPTMSKVWLVPKAGEIQFWISHLGLATLAFRAGIQLIPVPVHKNDHVVIDRMMCVEHDTDPDEWANSLDDLRGVYLSIRRLSDGADMGTPWLPIAAIKKRAAQGGPVWRSWPVEMAQKTAIKYSVQRGILVIDSQEFDQALSFEPGDYIDTPTEAREVTKPAPVVHNDAASLLGMNVDLTEAEDFQEAELVEVDPEPAAKAEPAPKKTRPARGAP